MMERLGRAATAVADAFDGVPEASTRRALFALTGTAALSLVAGRAEAQAVRIPPGSEAAGNWKSPTNRLVRRLSYGIEATEASKAALMGFDAYVNRQLNPEGIDDSAVEATVAANWPRMNWNEAQLYDVSDSYQLWLELLFATLHRSTFSQRLLYERMVEFWTDHFNVSIVKLAPQTLVPFVQKVIRPNAMGTFPDLLKATAHSAAMLNFLDNDANTAYAPNINYSRELHELHTVGAQGGYNGEDLRQAALVLSGWSWTWETNDPNRGKFLFRPYYHAGGTKVVMGQVYQENGQLEGEQMLNFLAGHAKTAEFVTKKMVKWFLGEPAPQAVCDAAKAAYLATGGDIREILRVILTPQNLALSKPRYKRPYHLLVSMLRSGRAAVTDFTFPVYALVEAGMVPWNWSFPDGYPDRFEYWVGGQIHRANMGLWLAGNFLPGVTIDVATTFGADRTPNGCLNAITKAFFGGEGSPDDTSALLAYLKNGPITDSRLQGAVAVAMACPSFQWY
ncbi:MAG: DUF1800 domain-containing protein [Armatimonadetes bacterium]|nr:DUF1800 domain-containing protein [Armatimonadota bacterium]